MELIATCDECGTVNEYEVEGKDSQLPLQLPCESCGAWVTMNPIKPPKVYKKKELSATA
jgi:hypothetical protein